MNDFVCMKRFLIHEDYYFEGIKIISCHIVYPQFIGNSNFLVQLNKNYYKEAIMKKEYCESILYQEAVQALLDGSKAFPYEIIATLTLTLQTDDIISFYQEDYLYTGGANGQTKRIGQTLQTKSGHILHLRDFVQNKQTYVSCIQNDIIKQIESSQDIDNYFDNYTTLVKTTFQPQNFYLTSEGIVVFFDLYDIAPHSTGIPTFLISYQLNCP